MHLLGRGSEKSGRISDVIDDEGERSSQERKVILLYNTTRCQRGDARGAFVRKAYHPVPLVFDASGRSPSTPITYPFLSAAAHPSGAAEAQRM